MQYGLIVGVRAGMIVGTAAVLVGAPGCEQQSETESASPWGAAAPQSENAAERYREIYAQIGEADLKMVADARGEPTPAVRQLLAEWSGQIEALVEATRLSEADWGIDYTDWVNTHLPHLRELRDLARLLNTDAQRAAADGEMDAAAQRLAAMVRMSRHVGGQSVIEQLVAYATLQLAMNSIREIAAEPGWAAAQRELLLAELQAIDSRDPLDGDAKLQSDQKLSAQAGQPGPAVQRFNQTRQRVVEELRQTMAALR